MLQRYRPRGLLASSQVLVALFGLGIARQRRRRRKVPNDPAAHVAPALRSVTPSASSSARASACSVRWSETPPGSGPRGKNAAQGRRSCKTRAGTSRRPCAMLPAAESCPSWSDRRGPRCARLSGRPLSRPEPAGLAPGRAAGGSGSPSRPLARPRQRCALPAPPLRETVGSPRLPPGVWSPTVGDRVEGLRGQRRRFAPLWGCAARRRRPLRRGNSGRCGRPARCGLTASACPLRLGCCASEPPGPAGAAPCAGPSPRREPGRAGARPQPALRTS